MARAERIYNSQDVFFSVRLERLLWALPHTEAKRRAIEMYGFKVTVDSEDNPTNIEQEYPMDEIVDYISFAYEKAQDERALSASRSITHFEELLWLLGENYAEFYEEFSANREADYAPYGWPLLRRIVAWFGLFEELIQDHE